MSRLDAIRRYVKGVAQNTMPLMITCAEFETFVLQYFEGEGLSGRQRFLFRVHLFFCRECRDYLAAYKRALEAGPRAFPDRDAPPEPPAELIEAVMRARRAG